MVCVKGVLSVEYRCSWLGECVIVTVCCIVCVIEYGWYVGRGDCSVCGWKDRCRDGNLRVPSSKCCYLTADNTTTPTCLYLHTHALGPILPGLEACSTTEGR